MKRLSVIIPGYNTPKEWWQRCVASVQLSIGPEDEIIIVDDGSTTPVEKDWFDREVVVVRKDNGGLSSARNRGLKIAQGEFVAFVDSDDEVKEGVYEECIARIKREQADIAVFGLETVWVQEGLKKKDLPDAFASHSLSPNDVNELLHRRVFNYAWNKVYRKSFIEGRNLLFDLEGMPSEDIIFNLQSVIAGARWCSVNRVGYRYYRDGMTLLSRYKPSNFTGLRHESEIWKRYKSECPEAAKLFGSYGEVTEETLYKAERANRLKPGSPFWFSKPYNLLRNLFYVRWIRRLRIKRMYPQAEEV